MYLVYILECRDGSLYTGITNDLKRRIKQHNAGKASKLTRSRLPVQCVYHEQQNDLSSARRREAEIKSWSRTEKLDLIGWAVFGRFQSRS